MSEEKNKKLIFQFILLMSLLIVTPIGTYFWMRGGVDYRMQRLSELKDFGKVGNFIAIDTKGAPFDTASLKDKMVLVTFLPDGEGEAKSLMGRIELVENQMEEQLDQRKDMMFLFVTTADDLDNYPKTLMTKDNDKFVFAQVNPEEMTRLKKEAFRLSEAPANEIKSEYPLVLVDLRRTIRHYYDPMNNQDMGKLVEHMAMILPQDKDKDLIFRRESEK